MILNKHACSHTTHVPTTLRRSFFVLAQFLGSNPQANGKEGKQQCPMVLYKGSRSALRFAERRIYSCKSRKGATLRAASAFSLHTKRDVLYETCYITELSLLRPINNSLDESRAVMCCSLLLIDCDEKHIIFRT